MQFKRIFTKENYKGMRNYLNSQKKYEVIRTAVLFAVPLSLFIAGYMATKSRLNLLTFVAILGSLPACKSLVDMIMHLRFHSCPPEKAEQIEAHAAGLETVYDMVFTTYKNNYFIAHAACRGNTVVLYTPDEKMDESACVKHLTDSLTLDGIKNVTLKVFKDIKKYTDRLEQLQNLEEDADGSQAVFNTLKSISL